MQTRLAFQRSAIAAVVAFGLPTLCLAQAAGKQPAPNRSRVQQVHVKPDMVNEWLDLQKNEVVPALKKGGTKTRTVYQTNIGNGFEFLIVTPFAKFAEFDADGAQVKALGQTAAARLAEKLRKCTDSNANWILTELTSISNIIPNSPPPAKIVSTRIRIAPGRMQDFQNLVKTDILPAFQKAKLSNTISNRGMGANPNDVVVTSPLSKYAELDAPSPLERALGQEGLAKLLPKTIGLLTVIETIVRTRVADLSF
jgi:hypothetical protein